MIRELRIIVAGSREFNDYDLLRNTLIDYLEVMDDTDVVDNPSQVKFISGTAKGADTLGEQFAYTYEYEVKRFVPEWSTYVSLLDIDVMLRWQNMRQKRMVYCLHFGMVSQEELNI